MKFRWRPKRKSKLSRIDPPFFQDRLFILLCGLVVTMLLGGMAIFPPHLLRYLDDKTYDLMLQSRPPAKINPIPLVVGIDDQSLKAYGQWPWPRYRIARLIEKIRDLGAASIGLDLLMVEPDRSSIPTIIKQWHQETGEQIDLPLTKYPDNDRILARVLAASPVVVGHKFIFNPDSTLREGDCLRPLEIAEHPALSHVSGSFPQARGVICNLPMLDRSAHAEGFINAKTDADGVLRRLPLVIEYGDDLYPSLALASLMMAERNPRFTLKSEAEESFLIWSGRHIPLDRNGYMLVGFKGGKKTFPYYSAVDILEDRVAPQVMRDKIVFIGAWATGLGDWHLSPLDKQFPGPEVHANVVDNILSSGFLHRPGWASGAELFLILVFGVIITLLLTYGSAAACFGLTCLLGLSGWIFFQWLFQTQQIYLSPIMPLATLFVNFALLGILKYGLEENKLRRRTNELLQAQDATIISLAALAETRDEETGKHLYRTQRYVRALATRLRQQDRGRDDLDEECIDLLFKSAPLHDIGKVGIPDHILFSKGELTGEEFDCMKQHPLIGGKVLERTSAMMGQSDGLPYLRVAREMAETHHERWDGTGYPYGLKGTEIPLSGRLMALADVYDALTSRRSYKVALSHEQSAKVIVDNRGKQFDPQIVDAFLQEQEAFRNIAREYADKQKST